MRRLFLAALLVSSPALAQDPTEDETLPNVTYQKVTEIEFDRVDVNAGIEKPSGVYMAERKRAAFHPFIQLRKDFDLEMSASVDEVK